MTPSGKDKTTDLLRGCHSVKENGELQDTSAVFSSSLFHRCTRHLLVATSATGLVLTTIFAIRNPYGALLATRNSILHLRVISMKTIRLTYYGYVRSVTGLNGILELFRGGRLGRSIIRKGVLTRRIFRSHGIGNIYGRPSRVFTLVTPFLAFGTRLGKTGLARDGDTLRSVYRGTRDVFYFLEYKMTSLNWNTRYHRVNRVTIIRLTCVVKRNSTQRDGLYHLSKLGESSRQIEGIIY